MPATDWTVGEGLREDGLPDPRWIGKSIMQVQPQPDGSWLVQIQWGSTWGHYTAASSQDPQEAFTIAVGRALADGCDPAWLPIGPNGWKEAV